MTTRVNGHSLPTITSSGLINLPMAEVWRLLVDVRMFGRWKPGSAAYGPLPSEAREGSHIEVWRFAPGALCIPWTKATITHFEPPQWFGYIHQSHEVFHLEKISQRETRVSFFIRNRNLCGELNRPSLRLINKLSTLIGSVGLEKLANRNIAAFTKYCQCMENASTAPEGAQKLTVRARNGQMDVHAAAGLEQNSEPTQRGPNYPEKVAILRRKWALDHGYTRDDLDSKFCAHMAEAQNTRQICNTENAYWILEPFAVYS